MQEGEGEMDFFFLASFSSTHVRMDHTRRHSHTYREKKSTGVYFKQDKTKKKNKVKKEAGRNV